MSILLDIEREHFRQSQRITRRSIVKNLKSLSVQVLYVLLTIGALIVASGAPGGVGGGGGG
jgi:hypothetical protein